MNICLKYQNLKAFQIQAFQYQKIKKDIDTSITIQGKFMVFPWVEKYLQQLHSSQKKLLDNTYEWMVKDNTLNAATNIETLDASLATYIGDLIL